MQETESYSRNADSITIRKDELKEELTFVNNAGDIIGKFYWENELKFEGNAEESAKVFIKYLKELWNFV